MIRSMIGPKSNSFENASLRLLGRRSPADRRDCHRVSARSKASLSSVKRSSQSFRLVGRSSSELRGSRNGGSHPPPTQVHIEKKGWHFDPKNTEIRAVPGPCMPRHAPCCAPRASLPRPPGARPLGAARKTSPGVWRLSVRTGCVLTHPRTHIPPPPTTTRQQHAQFASVRHPDHEPTHTTHTRQGGHHWCGRDKGTAVEGTCQHGQWPPSIQKPFKKKTTTLAF